MSPLVRAPKSALAVLAVVAAATGQHALQHGDQQQPMYVAPASDAGQRALPTFVLARGLQAHLVAAEPQLANVVAFTIDARGRIYTSETFRIHDGVFDTREHMDWKDEDLACRTVADRLRKYEKYLASKIPGYAAYSEVVRQLVDDNGDFVVDRSTVFADGFAELADGLASSVLAVGDSVWFANIPKLWRLQDQDGDGRAEQRTAVFDGFGVHSSLIGHDLHGLVLGLDGRLWFSIGDRGFHVATQEGTTLAYPHEGAVLRCELDGSNLEVVHRGLRNPQELAFDDFGNLFTGDNNSDGGDRARLVQVLPGADSGWRIGHQWLDDRGAWNRERLWQPQHPGQPAWIVPPIANVADGPSGLWYDCGIGMPARYRGCFYLCDFRGGSSYSGVHALRLCPEGAGFEIAWRDRPIWGVLATDCEQGPDGALYVSDWVAGWNKTGKGRLYRVETPGQRNDLQARAAARLLGADFADRSESQLQELLQHADRRVRQKAQQALVVRNAHGVLLAVAKDADDARARIAAVFGLGQLGRRDPAALAALLPLLTDGDADVRAVVARMLGEGRLQDAGDELVTALTDGSARVRREAAFALGRLGEQVGEATTAALLQLLENNEDRDPVLRHAAAFGLAGTTAGARLQQRSDHAKAAVRRGALLALRQRRDARVTAFLTDSDPTLRAEAARACYDAEIEGTLPALAAMLADDRCGEEAFGWRALNAARLLGDPDHATAIARFARNASRPQRLREEAVAILAEWQAPEGQCRVVGNWRPAGRDDPEPGVAAVMIDVTMLAVDPIDAIAAAAAAACASLHYRSAEPALADLAANPARSGKARTAALQALATLESSAVDAIVARITRDDPTELRTAAVTLFAERQPQKAAPVLATLCERAERKERQAAFAALGTLSDPAGARLLAEWLDALQQGRVDGEVQLDLLLAAAQRAEPEVQERLRRVQPPAGDDPLPALQMCREGGDVDAGRAVVSDHEATRCTRCHMLEGKGGNAGPVLDGVGSRLDRNQLLESLVAPSRQIATGFATTVLELHNDLLVVGVVTKDQDGMVTITDATGASQQVAWDRIRTRRQAPESAMPEMHQSLSKRQLRDVVAFLASLQAPPK